ncbi:MAG: GNAT family N-acetyltransferase [Bacteroidota bacterium]
MKITLSKATPQDLPAIYGLVKELAIYEKAPEEVTTTLEDYLTDFKAGYFESLVAKHNDKVVGMMLYYNTYSTWKGRMLYLEDFLVTETYRRMGIGDQLWEALLEEAKIKGARLIKWQVLDWNQPAIEFYKKKAATIEDEWLNGKVFL